jgi:predicted alpha/beta hydrolase
MTTRHQTTRHYDFVTKDQHHNQLSLRLPTTWDDATPIIVITPAMGVTATYYQPLCQEISGHGLIAATVDLRGLGQSDWRASRRKDYGYHEMVHCDWPAFLAAIRERHPRNPLFLMGHSLGGQLSLLYLSSHPHSVTGLILVASASVYHQCYDQPWKLLLQTQLAWAVAELMGHFPGDRIGFAGREARLEIRDWARVARTGEFRFRRWGHTHDYEPLLARLKMPVLAVSFDDDELAPAMAVTNLCRKIGACDIEHRHYQPAQLGHASLGHFQWVKRAERLIPEILPWITRQSASADVHGQ